jgi:hypothetical protein
VNAAVPKTILQLMNVEGMTRENVASHLQKYRLHLKRCAGLAPTAALPDDILQRSASFAPFGWSTGGAGGGHGGRAAAAPLPPPAPPPPPPSAHMAPGALLPPLLQPVQPPPGGGVGAGRQQHNLSAAQVASLVQSREYASLFAPGAGVSMPSSSLLELLVMGTFDGLGLPRPPEQQQQQPPPPGSG